MRRVILCCALLGALVLVAVACKSIADNTASSSTTTGGKSEEENSAPVTTPVTTPVTNPEGEPDTKPAPVTGSYKTIPQEQAKAEMDALAAEGKSFVLLDVRRLDEYTAAHIEGALLLPNEEIGTTRPDALPDLTAPIYVYCRSGNRSLQAAKKLAAMGYTVYDFGGILDWQYGTVSG